MVCRESSPFSNRSEQNNIVSLCRCASRKVLLVGRLWITAALLTALVEAPIPAADSAEYKFKAVYLYNFAQFVEWPPQAFSNPSAPIIIGILGKDPFGSILDQTVQGEFVHGRPLRVQRFSRIEDVGNCHLLFISDDERDHFIAILSRVGGSPILTVGETERFAERGGIINFINREGRLHFEMNKTAAQKAGLNISSKLLKLAKIVGDSGNKVEQ